MKHGGTIYWGLTYGEVDRAKKRTDKRDDN